MQEAFDAGSIHMLTQNTKSVMQQTGECKYRGPNGTKCPIGALIPDELYVPEMDDAGAYDIDGDTGVYALNDQWKLFNPSIVEFLGELQNIHDNKIEILWEGELFRLAEKFHLIPTSITNFHHTNYLNT